MSKKKKKLDLNKKLYDILVPGFAPDITDAEIKLKNIDEHIVAHQRDLASVRSGLRAYVAKKELFEKYKGKTPEQMQKVVSKKIKSELKRVSEMDEVERVYLYHNNDHKVPLIVIETKLLKRIEDGKETDDIGKFKFSIAHNGNTFAINYSYAVNERYSHPCVEGTNICWGEDLVAKVTGLLPEDNIFDIFGLFLDLIRETSDKDAYIKWDAFLRDRVPRNPIFEAKMFGGREITVRPEFAGGEAIDLTSEWAEAPTVYHENLEGIRAAPRATRGVSPERRAERTTPGGEYYVQGFDGGHSNVQT